MVKNIKKSRAGSAKKPGAKNKSKAKNAKLVEKRIIAKKAKAHGKILKAKTQKKIPAKNKAKTAEKMINRARKKMAKWGMKKKLPDLKNKMKRKSAKVKISVQEPQVQVRKELSRELQEILSHARVRHWLIELGGENTLEVIRSLPANPSDEELAKKLKIKISDVRASLNRLHNSGLVAYLRDKNSETGWYSYAWVLNEGRITKWVKERHESREALRPQGGVDFYFCKDCGLESTVRFEAAVEQLFKCASCSSSLDYLDEEKFERFRKIREGEV